MKKLLIIADEFPPMGGAGVQRTSKFTKYLPLFDYMPYVFTRSDNDLVIRDDSLMKDIPKYVEVTRTKSYDFLYKKNIIGKILYYKLLIPDGRFIWYLRSRKKALKLVKKIKPEILYTTSFPYSDHLMGLYLKKKLPDLKWVADFRDEWTNNPYFNYNPLRQKIEKNMERKIMDKADSLITNTPIMMNNFINTYPLTKEKFNVIPNGFDPDDYSSITKKQNKNTKFTITYTGSLYGLRKPDTFLQALSELIAQKKISKDKIKVNFIGNLKEDEMKQLVASLNLTENVNIVSYMKHKDCLDQLSLSDCSLLIEGNAKGSKAFYTGKIFEYFNIHNPILAVIPKDGAAAMLINDTNTGLIADYSNVNEIKKATLKLYRAWENDEIIIQPDYDKINQFSRKKLTEKLSAVFDKLC